MTDSDTDDSFLLEALESIEQTQANFSDHKGIRPNPVSSGKSAKDTSSQCEKVNDNFRAHLLNSLQTCRTNAINSKSEKSNEHGNLSTKRKLSEKEMALSTDNRNLTTNRSLEVKKAPKFNFNSPFSSIVKKRKFPGPAGILPEWGQRCLKLSSTDCKTSQFDNDSVKESVCSQSTAQDFVSGPWKEMYLDLEIMTNPRSLLQNHNIKCILRKNALRSQTCIRKISFLAVMIRSIDLSHQDATAVFHDETGEIQGTVSDSVLEKFGPHISCGTVFVLKDATILSPSLFQPGVGIMGQLKKHYLTVTLNSIVTIYSPNDDGQVKKVEVISLTEQGLESLLSMDESFRERTELIENEENEQQQQQQQMPLFENIGSDRGMNYKVSRNQANIPEYKSPIYNSFKNSPNIAKSGAYISKNFPKSGETISNINKNSSNLVRHVPKLESNSNLPNNISYSRSNLNTSKPAQNFNIPDTPIPCSSTTSIDLKSPNNEPTERLKTFSFCRNNIIKENCVNNSIKSAAEAFGSFSDDEEFDSLLASINTDAL